MQPDSSTGTAESSAAQEPVSEREDVLWQKLYGAVEEPAVAAVFVEHMFDHEVITPSAKADGFSCKPGPDMRFA